MPARKNSSRYPTERTLEYVVPANSSQLIDVAKGLSAINHRLYRQMRGYHVSVELLTSGTNPTTQGVKLYTVPDTWFVKKSCELAKEHAQEQYNMSDRKMPRWMDFRIGWSSALKTALSPVDDSGAAVPIDENAPSEVYDVTAGADFQFVMFGAARDAGNNCYGVVEQYDQLGDVQVPSPAIGASDAYAELTPNPTLTEQAGDEHLNGDQPPYDGDSFNFDDDNAATKQRNLYNAGGGDMRLSDSFMSPLGLIKVSGGGENCLLRVNVHAGSYKGVKSLDW